MAHPLADPSIEVTTDDVADRLASGEDVQVVDVREAYEREAGHIDGTRHIELERLASQAETLDRDKPVIFTCRLGSRSLMAAQAFRRAGFDAWSMAGGIQGWADEGRPVAGGGQVADH